MTFVESVSTCFEKYRVFDGRASRSEFWWFAAFQFVVGVLVATIGTALGLPSHELRNLGSAVHILLAPPYAAVTARRLHDINRSGWWQLIVITLIGIIPLIYWLCRQGDPYPNRYEQPS